MSDLCQVIIIQPEALSGEDEALWDSLVANRPDLIGPYFDVRYVKAIASIVPHAYIAKLYNDQGLAGFFACQKRGRCLQPLGAPLSDYNGIISDRALKVCYAAILRAFDADRFDFQGWLGEMAPGKIAQTHTTQVCDLSHGFEAYLAHQSEANHKFFKNARRCKRNVAKDLPNLRFDWEPVSCDVVNWVIARKREQYKLTNLHDVFGCGWTQNVLRVLAQFKGADFGLFAAVYRLDGQILAADICLRAWRLYA